MALRRTWKFKRTVLKRKRRRSSRERVIVQYWRKYDETVLKLCSLGPTRMELQHNVAALVGERTVLMLVRWAGTTIVNVGGTSQIWASTDERCARHGKLERSVLANASQKQMLCHDSLRPQQMILMILARPIRHMKENTCNLQAVLYNANCTMTTMR